MTLLLPLHPSIIKCCRHPALVFGNTFSVHNIHLAAPAGLGLVHV
jgi:hypothetical protein